MGFNDDWLITDKFIQPSMKVAYMSFCDKARITGKSDMRSELFYWK